MKEAASVLEMLASLRRRWVETFAREAVRCESALRQARPEAGNPFAVDDRLATLAHQLAELQTLMTAMEQTVPPALRRRPDDRPQVAETRPSSTPFSAFIALVMENRYVEAAQELARILPMPVDHLTTATDFFARAVHVNPGLAGQLDELCLQLDTLSDPDAAKTLIHTLGFQAVEAQFAVDTLRRIWHSRPIGAIAPVSEEIGVHRWTPSPPLSSHRPKVATRI